MSSFFIDGPVSVEIPSQNYGYTQPRNLGEARSETEGGELYQYKKGATVEGFEQLLFANMSTAKKEEVLDFLEAHAGGLEFTFQDYLGVGRQVVNVTEELRPVHDGFERWSLALQLRLV